IFSGGYFALDDHFLVIEPASSWVQAPQYSTWLPWNQGGDPHPSGHSFVYVGLHYLLFSVLRFVGLVDPELQMVVVRLLHALWSLVVVRVGYRIALRLSDPQVAWHTGLFLALLFFMPFLSVRNLVEVACIPFLMLGAQRLLGTSTSPTPRDLLVAGIWIGLAMNIRFQTIFFAAGPGLALLVQKQVRSALLYGLGVALPLLVLQGGIDLVMWGRPFAELTEYVLYNLNNTTTYGVLPWYNYLLLLAGLFIPPFSLAVGFGFFRRTTPLLLWLPVLLFIAIHSYFPNKQERFLLPIVPLYFVLGYVAWEMWRQRSAWWQQRTGLWRGILRWTWGLNLVLLLVLCFSYSKRSRVMAQVMLQEMEVRGMVIEDSAEGEAPMPPLFYSRHWTATVVPWTDPVADLGAELARHPAEQLPNIVLFCGTEELPQRMQRTMKAMGPLEIVGVAQPGLLDRTVHWLNPVNRNEAIVVARVR
ncbi:MAG: glycosyltransferase family 39 protein, partial [Flavobacteriales bacterium]|nr:glycosyltransferase family 39 protein [Flavobacteriales bacterium]